MNPGPLNSDQSVAPVVHFGVEHATPGCDRRGRYTNGFLANVDERVAWR